MAAKEKKGKKQEPELLLCVNCDAPDERRQRKLERENILWAKEELAKFQCGMCFGFSPLTKRQNGLKLSKWQQHFAMELEPGRALPLWIADKPANQMAKPKRTASLADDVPGWTSEKKYRA